MKQEDLIMSISIARMANNGLWLALLELALKAAPEETKIVLRQINANDIAISAMLGELAQ